MRRVPETSAEQEVPAAEMASGWRDRIRAHLAKTEHTSRPGNANARGTKRSDYLRRQDRARRAAIAELVSHHPDEWDMALTFAKKEVGLATNSPE